MQINSRAIYELLILHMVRCERVARQALDRINPTDFEPTPGKDFSAIWFAASEYWKINGCPPPKAHLLAHVENLVGQRGYEERLYIEPAIRLIDVMYAYDDDGLMPEYGLALMRAFTSQKFREWVTYYADRVPDDKLPEMVAEQLRRRTITQSPSIQIFDMDDVPEYAKRVELGVAFIDVLLGGGLAPAELMGLLGPSSGGKTLLSCQIAVQVARKKDRVLFFSYESPIQSDIRLRLLSYAAEIPKSVTDKISSFKELPEKYKERLRREAPKLKPYLFGIDCSSTGSSVDEIEATLQEHQSNHGPVRLVIVDWMWPLVMRHMAATATKKQERMVLQMMMNQFKSMAAKHNINMLLVHQLQVKSAAKSPGTKPQWFQAAEAGSFAWELHQCFAIGTASPSSGKCWLVASKNRNFAKGETLVRLRGEMNRFESADMDFAVYDHVTQDFVEKEDVKKADSVPELQERSGMDDVQSGGALA